MRIKQISSMILILFLIAGCETLGLDKLPSHDQAKVKVLALQVDIEELKTEYESLSDSEKNEIIKTEINASKTACLDLSKKVSEWTDSMSQSWESEYKSVKDLYEKARKDFDNRSATN